MTNFKKLTLLFALLVLVGSGCSVAQNNGGEVNNNGNEVVDTSDWLVYENEEYGFSFEYPSGWSLVKDGLPSNIIRVQVLGDKQKVDGNFNDGSHFTVTVFKDQRDLSQVSLERIPEHLEKSDIVFVGENAVYAKGPGSFLDKILEDSLVEYIVIKKDEEFYLISSFSTGANHKEYSSTAGQIIRSFKL